MSNVLYAIDHQDNRVAEFLSRDYDPLALVEEYGPVRIYDKTQGGRFIAAVPEDRFVIMLPLTVDERDRLLGLLQAEHEDTQKALGALPVGEMLRTEIEKLYDKIANTIPSIKETT